MDLVPFRPFRSLMSWPDFWDETDLSWETPGRNLDVYETEDEVVIQANVAGVQVKDVDITFEDGVLWIKAQKEEEETDKDKTHYRKSSWAYSYKVAVPGKIDLNKEPTAEVKDGVLTVTFEKSEVSKPKKLKVTAK
jgi:HSP20 family protein